MEQIPCVYCGDFFDPSPRHKNQTACKRAKCQKAKKAAWQRHKMKTDPVYAANQKSSQQQWVKANPGFWKQYRKDNPHKAERNRILQAIRNRRARSSLDPARMDPALIAKMDASKSDNFQMLGQFWLLPVIAKMDALKSDNFQMLGQFWLLPVIAKMDALKVNIVKIPICYP